MPECRSCAAPIRWAVTENGRRIPLDATPVDDGNVHLYDGVAYVLDPHGAAIVEHRMSGDDLYVSHFATCKDSNQWRKR